MTAQTQPPPRPAGAGAGCGSAAVLGLGAMGLPIARAIADAGWQLRACDVDEGRLAQLGDRAELRTSSPAEAAAGSDVVVVAVATDEQLERAALGDHGALARMRSGTMLIVHSTVSPGICGRIAVAAADRGVAVVDAPLSGGVAGAEGRSLTCILGCRGDIVERASEFVGAYAPVVFPVGDVGAGQAVKLVNNLLATVSLAATAEALELARSAGLDEDVVLRVVNASSGRSWATEGWHAILDGYRRSPGGLDHVREAILRKDLRLAEGLGEQLAVALPVAGAALAAVDAIGAETGARR